MFKPCPVCSMRGRSWQTLPKSPSLTTETRTFSWLLYDDSIRISFFDILWALHSVVKSETGVFWLSVESVQIGLKRHSISSRLDLHVGKHSDITLLYRIGKVVYVHEKQSRAKGGSLWNSRTDGQWLWYCATPCDKLSAIRKVWLEPLKKVSPEAKLA